MSEHYSAGRSQEMFYGLYESREQAIEDTRDGENVTVWSGRVVDASAFVKGFTRLGETVLEQAESWLYDETRVDSEIIELPKQKEAELNALIVAFLIEHATFNAFGVRDVQEHQPDPSQPQPICGKPVAPSGPSETGGEARG